MGRLTVSLLSDFIQLEQDWKRLRSLGKSLGAREAAKVFATGKGQRTGPSRSRPRWEINTEKIRVVMVRRISRDITRECVSVSATCGTRKETLVGPREEAHEECNPSSVFINITCNVRWRGSKS